MYFYRICKSLDYESDYIILPKIVFDYIAEHRPLLRTIAMNDWTIKVIDSNNLDVPIEHTYSFIKDSGMYLKFNSLFKQSGLSMDKTIQYTKDHINGTETIFKIELSYTEAKSLIKTLTDLDMNMKEKFDLESIGDDRVDIEQFKE